MGGGQLALLGNLCAPQNMREGHLTEESTIAQLVLVKCLLRNLLLSSLPWERVVEQLALWLAGEPLAPEPAVEQLALEPAVEQLALRLAIEPPALKPVVGQPALEPATGQLALNPLLGCLPVTCW